MGPTSWNAVKLVLAAGTPIQKLFSGKGNTHLFCNWQAMQILNNDNKNDYARLLNNYLEVINRGVLWADRGWKNFSHYFDPWAGQGFGPWPNAKSECTVFFNKAISEWSQGNKKKSFFFIGAAAHLVQDLCVPHHSNGVAFCGHKEYEKWVQDNCVDFGVFSAGNYITVDEPGEWVEFNAIFSRNYFPYVSNSSSFSSYKMVTRSLLPLAQRSTAGFFSYFLDSVKYNRN